MTSFGYHLNPRYAIKEYSSCGALYTRDCSCSKGNVEDKILIPKPSKNCARCGHPVDGPYCQGCALLRKKLEEDLDHGSLVDKIICDLNKAPDSPHLHTFSLNEFHCFHCKDVLGDGENSLNDSPSISANSSQNPPHIDEHCYECDDALDGIFCKRCTCFNQTQPPQFPVIHPPPQETSIEILHDQKNVINVVQTFLRKFNRYSFFETPKVLLLAWDRVFEINDAFGNKQYKPEDIQELFRKLLNDLQNIHEELAEYINSLGWNLPALYDDDDDDDVDYTIAITPDDDYLYNENIEYVEASPHDSELVSLEAAKIVIPEDEEIKDDNLREKLLNVNLLIAKIESLKDNPTSSFEFLTKSSFTSPKSFFEETNTFDNSLPEFKNFCFDLEEISSGSTTTHYDISLSEYDSFIVDLSNDQFPPTDRSDFTHEEFAVELAYIISPPVIVSTLGICPIRVKERQEKDKIGTKPDKTGQKREAWKSPEMSKTNHSRESRKREEIQSQGANTDKP
nr:hypothetical protein [Tanacetum cinerariifolium]